MPQNNLEDLSNIKLDTLREIGNIGQGKAASALADMIGGFVEVSVPSVKMLDFDKTVNYLGNAEETVIGIMFALGGDIGGMMLLVLRESAAHALIKSIMGYDAPDLLHFSDSDISCITEIANILAGSYVSAISDLTGLDMSVSVPGAMIDMVGAILSIPAVEFAKTGNKVLLIDDNFVIGNMRLMSNILLMPDVNSLSVFFSKLGVEC